MKDHRALVERRVTTSQQTFYAACDNQNAAAEQFAVSGDEDATKKLREADSAMDRALRDLLRALDDQSELASQEGQQEPDTSSLDVSFRAADAEGEYAQRCRELVSLGWRQLGSVPFGHPLASVFDTSVIQLEVVCTEMGLSEDDQMEKVTEPFVSAQVTEYSHLPNVFLADHERKPLMESLTAHLTLWRSLHAVAEESHADPSSGYVQRMEDFQRQLADAEGAIKQSIKDAAAGSDWHSSTLASINRGFAWFEWRRRTNTPREAATIGAAV